VSTDERDQATRNWVLRFNLLAAALCLLVILGYFAHIWLRSLAGPGGLGSVPVPTSPAMALPPAIAYMDAANLFVDNLLEGKPDAAYLGTSPLFQQTHSPADFRYFVRQYAVLGGSPLNPGRSIRCTGLPSLPGGAQPIQVTIEKAAGSLSFTLVLVRQGGQWMVQSIDDLPEGMTDFPPILFDGIQWESNVRLPVR
jgi:hypothetical protein